MIFMVEDDTNLMNKYRITFYSMIQNNSSKSAKKDYVDFAKRFSPDSAQAIT